MKSNAPEFLADIAAEIYAANPGYFLMKRFFRDHYAPAWLAEIYRDSALVCRLKESDHAGPSRKTRGLLVALARCLGRGRRASKGL